MRQLTSAEWNDLIKCKEFYDPPSMMNGGVIENYKSKHPGYVGPLYVIVKDQPESVNVFGKDRAGRLYKIFSSYD